MCRLLLINATLQWTATGALKMLYRYIPAPHCFTCHIQSRRDSLASAGLCRKS